MAASRKPYRKYQTPGVVNGNLARKLDRQELERRLDDSGRMDFDQLYRRQKPSEVDRRVQRRAQVKAAVRPAQHVSLTAVAGCLLAAGLTVVLLLCYVQMNTISRSVVSMKNEIDQLKVEQVTLMTLYERAFDLSTVKEAAEAAGMTQPSDSQVIYIRLPGENQATAHSAGGGLEQFFAAFRRETEPPGEPE